MAPPPQRPLPVAAYVRLPGFPSRAVGEIKWWRRLTRETRQLLATKPRAVPSALHHARSGFYPSSVPLYELDGPRARDYVSDRHKELSWGVNWPAAQLLDDKLAFFFMLKHFGVPQPEALGVVVRGRTAMLPGHEQGLRRSLEERGKLVVRPTRGAAGVGLWMLDLDGGRPRINGETLDWLEFEAALRTLDDHVVTEFAEQGPYSQAIYPGTTNTIRLLTFREGDEPPFLAVAAHRFGVPKSGPADNWSQGGLSALVDLETGKLSSGVARPVDGPLERHAVHPTTGAQIEGVVVPHWDAIRSGVLNAAREMGFFRFVGWDVIVTEGGYTLIEGNKYPDVHLVQVHAPLMGDDRVREFYTRVSRMRAGSGGERASDEPGKPVVRLPNVPLETIGDARWRIRLAREAVGLARRPRRFARSARPSLRSARDGFTPTSAALYRLDDESRGEYLSDRERELSWMIDWPSAGLLDDKLAFFFMLKHLGVPTPPVRGVVFGGRAHPVDGLPADPDWLRRVLAEGRPLVVRPTRPGLRRRGFRLDPAAEGCRVDGELVSWSELGNRVRGLNDHIITEWVEQGAYSRRVAPGTTNTLQVITAHPGEGLPFIVAAVHRFGLEGATDDVLVAGVDRETGVLAAGALRSRAAEARRLESHPVTGATLAGTAVPHWPSVREGLLATADRLPFLPYVGWEVIVTDTGFSVVAGDKSPDVQAAQLYGPLLRDPRVRAFYADQGVLAQSRAAAGTDPRRATPERAAPLANSAV